MALYSYARHQGRSPIDAEDATQEFLSKIVQSRLLNEAVAEHGRLRTLLAVTFKRFLIDDYRRSTASKRGGDYFHISIDSSVGETHLERLGDNSPNPDEFFDRAFASSLMDRAVDLLQKNYQSQNKAELFEVIKPSLLGATSPGEFACWAAQLNSNQAAIRVAVHRLRKRFREIFRTVVLETVAEPDDLDEELSILLEAVS